MAWKDYSSANKGGLISFCISLLLYIIIMFFSARELCEFNTVENKICTTSEVMYAFFFNFDLSFIIPILIIFLIFFIIGALIGWIYGKYKGQR